MYTRLRDMIMLPDSPMEMRMLNHGLSGLIPNTRDARDAIHELVNLRQDTACRRLLDPIKLWLDCLPLRPSEKIEGRRTKVRDAKARCLRAGISAEIIDDIFPEPPLALDSLEQPETLLERIRRRWALHCERSRHAAHMDGC